MTKEQLIKELSLLAKPNKAKEFKKFYKTGPGQYAQGLKLWGITVPNQRQAIQNYLNLTQADLLFLLQHQIHEVRFSATLILVAKYSKAKSDKARQSLFNFYKRNLHHFNNWDLIDLSAAKILGHYLYHYANTEAKSILLKLLQSNNLWRQRSAIVACHYFIKAGSETELFYLLDRLAQPCHDLLAKASGWMLREVGKEVSVDVLASYLRANYANLASVTLSYALEHFPQESRQEFYQLRKKANINKKKT